MTHRHEDRTVRFPLARPFVAVLLLTLGTAVVQASDGALPGALPPEKSAGGISYREGGIGSPEAQAMEAHSDQYPLMLSFAEQQQNRHPYVADVDVDIEQQNGNTHFSDRETGPLMLVDLPQGRYEVTATYKGKSMTRMVTIQPQQTERVYFEWNQI